SGAVAAVREHPCIPSALHRAPGMEEDARRVLRASRGRVTHSCGTGDVAAAEPLPRSRRSPWNWPAPDASVACRCGPLEAERIALSLEPCFAKRNKRSSAARLTP